MKKGTKIVIGVIAGIVILGIIVPKKDRTSKDQETVTTSSSNPNISSSSNDHTSGVPVGQPLHTQYFDVTVNKYDIKDRVNTGNQFTDLGKEEGTKYLIIDVSFKNTDKETRTMLDGVVLISNGGNVYRYEQPEPIMLPGWGLLLDNINPGVTKRTKLVYKIPADVAGTISFNPARAGDDEVILLGKI